MRPLAAMLLPFAVISPALAQEAPASIMALVHADRWSEAQAAAAAYPDPVAAKIVTYYRALAPHAASLAELERFLATSPDWPQQALLTRRRDEAIAAEPDDGVALAACDRDRPAAAPALLRCGTALVHAGRLAAATAAARAAWVAGPDDAAWETAALADWAPLLDAATLALRFDRLAWADTAGAARQIARLPEAAQLAAETRVALRRDDPQAEALLAELPADQRAEPPIVFEQARWLRRQGRDADALAFWRSTGFPAEAAAPAERRPLFWTEREILARHRLRDGDPAGAYEVSDDTTDVSSAQAAESAFLAGWIALRRLSDPALAQSQFARLARASSAAISQGRAHYWLARAAQAAGDAGTAGRENAAAAAYVTTFYGQLAAGADVSTRIATHRDTALPAARAQGLIAGELGRAATYLAAWGETRRATTFLLRLAELAPEPAELAAAARFASELGIAQAAVAIARLAGRDGVALIDAGWPIAADTAPGGPGSAPGASSTAGQPPPDPALVLGVIRQESSFDPGTVSPAGARGLMQLMPATAQSLARRLGTTVTAAALTASPATNIRLGSAYLGELMEGYAGAVPLAVAAYNAGPNHVREWLQTNGDPRSGDPDMVDWIELIPFGETRNYVQRVIENMTIYRVKLGEKPAASLPWRASPA